MNTKSETEENLSHKYLLFSDYIYSTNTYFIVVLVVNKVIVLILNGLQLDARSRGLSVHFNVQINSYKLIKLNTDHE